MTNKPQEPQQPKEQPKAQQLRVSLYDPSRVKVLKDKYGPDVEGVVFSLGHRSLVLVYRNNEALVIAIGIGPDRLTEEEQARLSTMLSDLDNQLIGKWMLKRLKS